VAVKDGEVILTGSVNDRHAKRRSEDVASLISGVRDVQNLLRVVR
jgi:osmotically-inducible protein OsmY